MRIQPALPEDAPPLAALEARTFPWHEYPLGLRAFRYHIKKNNLLLVAKDAGKPVGYVLALSYLHSGRIYSLAVDETYRGRGLGARLLKEALKRLDEVGKRRVTLEVRADAAGLIAFYQKAGFREIQALLSYYGEGRDGLRMVLLL